MATVVQPLTYDDLLALPDDGRRYELIDGELIELTSPSTKHQLLILRLGGVLDVLVTRLGLGWVFPAPLDVYLAPTNVVQPDLVFVGRERAAIVHPNVIRGVPNLVVEILSPSTRVRDETRKKNLYARFGVDEYWLVDHNAETIRVYALVDGRYELVEQAGAMLRSLVLPALELDVPALFVGVR